MGLTALPESDRACMDEAVLLAPAVIGGAPDIVDAKLRVDEALSVLPDPSVSVHVVTRLDGRLVLEMWIERRADGSGRHHRTAPPGSSHWPTIEVDQASTPATDRLEALCHRASRVSQDSPRDAGTLEFLGNAVRVAREGSDPFRRAVRDAALDAFRPDRLGAGVDIGPLVRLLNDSRERGMCDGLAAAELTAVLQLGVAIGNLSGDVEVLVEVVRYLVFGCLQVGEGPRQIGLVLARAVRENLDAALASAAEACLAEGTELMREALDLPEPSRVRFTKILYDGCPSMLAARMLAGALVDLRPDQDGLWLGTYRVADERSVRFMDGMTEQWADLGNHRLADERRRVMAAAEAGDRRTVRRILTEGEEALRRPRCLRPYLEGDA